MNLSENGTGIFLSQPHLQQTLVLGTYQQLDQFVEAFATGTLNLLVILGRPGVQKSRAVKAADGINTLADWCDRGLRVISVTQQIDFNGATGKMLAAVLLEVGQSSRAVARLHIN